MTIDRRNPYSKPTTSPALSQPTSGDSIPLYGQNVDPRTKVGLAKILAIVNDDRFPCIGAK